MPGVPSGEGECAEPEETVKCPECGGETWRIKWIYRRVYYVSCFNDCCWWGYVTDRNKTSWVAQLTGWLDRFVCSFMHSSEDRRWK